MEIQSDAKVGKFLQDYYSHLLQCSYAHQFRYWDRRRFGDYPDATLVKNIKRYVKSCFAKRGWAVRHFSLQEASREMAFVSQHQGECAYTYSLLGDAYSRRTFLDVLAYRALGGQHVRMPKNTKEYWRRYERDDEHLSKRGTVLAPWGGKMNEYVIHGRSQPYRLNLLPGAYQYYFTTRAYDYNQEGRLIGVRPNDVVIDGGGCWGETAVIFADESAPGGRVFTFEFVPENIQIMQMNIDLNPSLKQRIEHVKRAIADVSGKKLPFTSSGPGSSVAGSKVAADSSLLAETIALDDLVRERGLTKVDFLKLDIEGSEMKALYGAEQLIRRFKPRLAISLYHKPEDLFAIPAYISSLGLGYQMFLDHFTVHGEETVLFAE